MQFYILLVVVLVALFAIAYRYPNLDKYTGFFLFGILVVIGGFRDEIGYDYQNYINWYIDDSRSEGIHSLEIGYICLMRILRLFDLDYRYLFFIISFFTYFFVYLGVKSCSRKVTLPLILYTLIPVMFLYSFTYIRQFLAVAIGFYAFNLLLNKKHLWFFVLMFLGTSLHYSCFMTFVVFILVFKFGRTIQFNYLYALLCVTFILAQFGIINLISLFLKNSHYLFYVSPQTYAVPILKLLVMNSFATGIILYFNKYGFDNQYQKYYLLLFIISICVLNLFSESIDLTRLYIYFRIFEICLVSDIFYRFFKKKYIVFILILCVFYIIPFFMALNPDTVNPKLNKYKLAPYRSLLLDYNT